MNTFQEQKDFFSTHWDKMKEAVEKDGAKGVIDFIGTFSDDLEKRVLYVFARQGLSMGEWEGKNFDTYIEVADAGIAEINRQLENAADDDKRKKRRTGLHVISYNLSADLADCWPGDIATRSDANFERGLKAAEDCLRWAEINESPHSVFSMDFWAKGMHQLSLGRFKDADESWTSSLGHAIKGENLETAPEILDQNSSFGIILNTGYVGLAKLAQGETDDPTYNSAISAFESQLEIEDKKSDAQFGIDQLETVKSRYLG